MRILIVDDHTLFREGLSSLLNSQAGVEVVGEAGTRVEAISKARELNPDIILMDYSLPDGNGSEATKEILATNPDIKVVFLSIYDTDEHLFSAIRSGAKGYLLKNTPVTRLVSALRGLEFSEAPLSPVMTARVLAEFASQGQCENPERYDLADLTLREIDILSELAIDAHNGDIAKNLSLSETTVKNHVHNILRKLNLKNRQEAARFARNHGLSKQSSEILANLSDKITNMR